MYYMRTLKRGTKKPNKLPSNQRKNMPSPVIELNEIFEAIKQGISASSETSAAIFVHNHTKDLQNAVLACYNFFLHSLSLPESSNFLAILNQYLVKLTYSTSNSFHQAGDLDDSTLEKRVLNHLAEVLLDILEKVHDNSSDSPVSEKKRLIVFIDNYTANQKPNDRSFCDVLVELTYKTEAPQHVKDYTGLKRLLELSAFKKSFTQSATDGIYFANIEPQKMFSYKIDSQLITSALTPKTFVSNMFSFKKTASTPTTASVVPSAPPAPADTNTPLYSTCIFASFSEPVASDFQAINISADAISVVENSSTTLDASVKDFAREIHFAINTTLSKLYSIHSFDTAQEYRDCEKTHGEKTLAKATKNFKTRLEKTYEYFQKNSSWINKREMLAYLNLILKPIAAPKETACVDTRKKRASSTDSLLFVYSQYRVRVLSREARESIELNRLSRDILRQLDEYHATTIDTPLIRKVRGLDSPPPTFFDVLIDMMLDSNLAFEDCRGLAELKDSSFFISHLLTNIENSSKSAEEIRNTLLYRVASEKRGASPFAISTQKKIDDILTRKENAINAHSKINDSTIANTSSSSNTSVSSEVNNFVQYIRTSIDTCVADVNCAAQTEFTSSVFYGSSSPGISFNNQLTSLYTYFSSNNTTTEDKKIVLVYLNHYLYSLPQMNFAKRYGEELNKKLNRLAWEGVNAFEQYNKSQTESALQRKQQNPLQSQTQSFFDVLANIMLAPDIQLPDYTGLVLLKKYDSFIQALSDAITSSDSPQIKNTPAYTIMMISCENESDLSSVLRNNIKKAVNDKLHVTSASSIAFGKWG